jgi:outer membrane protein OmpA-like peptidoglycan-associated protein
MILVGLLAACSDGGNTASSSAGTTGPASSAAPSPTPEQSTTSTPTPTVDPLCAPGAGRTVRQLPDIVVPEVKVAPVTAIDAAGAQTTAVEGFTLPAEIVDAGCVIQYDAPGGCLGAVRISGSKIPAATVPASSVAGSRKVFQAVSVTGVEAPAVYAPQVCQVEDDGVLPTVTRKGVVRRGVARNGTARPGGTSKSDCSGSGCLPEVKVETVRIPPVRLPDVDVDPARLESRKLPGQSKIDVFTGDGKVSYVAPGDVVFDTDQATIRPDAASALHAIAVKIKAASPNARLRVEGHTDDRGDATYGLRLSERRAQAVALWLVRNEHFRSALLTTKGFGETAPAVPNTSDANRQKNRRVVIIVAGR